MSRLLNAYVFASLGLAATPAGATLLTFDGAICGGKACVNGDEIDPHYGSTPLVEVSYNHDTTEPGADHQLWWWNAQYSNLVGVVYGAIGSTLGVPAIVLTPLAGGTVTLNGFDLGAWPNEDRETQVTILEGSTVVYSSALDVSGVSGFHFGGVYSSASPITIEWGPDGYDVGIDNVSFTGTAGSAPEPSTWAMMLLGFAGLGFAAMRRTQGLRAIV
jgi:hypothetical protein